MGENLLSFLSCSSPMFITLMPHFWKYLALLTLEPLEESEYTQVFLICQTGIHLFLIFSSCYHSSTSSFPFPKCRWGISSPVLPLLGIYKLERTNKLGVGNQQIQTIMYKIHEQQGCTVQHRALYPSSCNNLEWNTIRKNIESLCCTFEANIIL